jgi:hypothetical protein
MMAAWCQLLEVTRYSTSKKTKPARPHVHRERLTNSVDPKPLQTDVVDAIGGSLDGVMTTHVVTPHGMAMGHGVFYARPHRPQY